MSSIRNPRFRAITADNVINPVGGANPVDAGIVDLQNIRGQLIIQGTAADSGISWSFEVKGSYQGTPDDNYYVINGTFSNCIVNTIQTNKFSVITSASDAGGRKYEITFSPYVGKGPTIHQSSPNVLGNNALLIKMVKCAVYL